MHYQTDLSRITSEMLDGFCVGWLNPLTGEQLLTIMQRSYRNVLAIDNDTVAGFANALSDGIRFAFVPMLEVLPAYQGEGIGTELLRRMLDELKDIPNIDLSCDEEMQPYYQRFGMHCSHGMIIRK